MIGLVRRWAVDWLASHDAGACDDLLAADYALTIGPVELRGRQEYVEATTGQLRSYPGLCLTPHDVVVTARHAALRFTEHGAARHRDGRLAAWGGIALFESDGEVLLRGWAEEDYLSRARQLRSGTPDPIEAPAVAPWDVEVREPDENAERTVRGWLDDGAPLTAGLLLDDGWRAPAGAAGEDAASLGPIDLDVLFSCGSAVAFHGRRPVDGGFSQGVVGLVRVERGTVVSGHLLTDRHGRRAAERSADA